MVVPPSTEIVTLARLANSPGIGLIAIACAEELTSSPGQLSYAIVPSPQETFTPAKLPRKLDSNVEVKFVNAAGDSATQLTQANSAIAAGADALEVCAGLADYFNVDPLIQKQAACISTMTYNEYGQVLNAGISPEELTVFNYRDEGVGMLEDGLYGEINSGQRVDFIRITFQGLHRLAHEQHRVQPPQDQLKQDERAPQAGGGEHRCERPASPLRRCRSRAPCSDSRRSFARR